MEEQFRFNWKHNLSRAPVFSWILGVVTILVFLIFFETLFYYKNQENKLRGERNAITFGSELISELDRQLNKLIYLNSGIQAFIKIHKKKIDLQEIQLLLKEIHRNSPLVHNFSIAEGTTIKYVEPIDGNEKAIGINYRNLPDQWPIVEKTIKSRKGTLTPPLNLVQGGRAIIYRQAIFIDTAYWGLLSTVIDIDSLFKAAFSYVTNPDYTFAIRTYTHDSKEVNLYGKPELFHKKQAVIMPALVPNNKWEYAIVPTKADPHKVTLNTYRWICRFISLIPGVLILILAGFRRKIVESESKYRLLAENASDVIWIYNLNKEQYSYLSPSVFQLRGYKPEEIINQTLYETVHPSSLQTVQNTLSTALADFRISHDSSKTYLAEFELPCKNGDTVWAEISGRLRYNEKKEIEIVGITRNIDKRKKIQLLLEQSESRLKAIIDSTLTGISILDREGRIIFTNPSSELIHGFTQQDLIGKQINTVVHPDDMEFAQQLIKDIVTEKVNFRDEEIRLIHKANKETVWIHTNITKYPLLTESGKIAVLVVFQNITKQKENEKQLMEVNESKDKFISILAHDLKNPLASVLGFSELLTENYSNYDGPRIQKYLGYIHTTSKNTLNLLDNLLNWARSQQGKIPFNPHPENLRSIVDECTVLLDNMAKSKKVQLTNQIASDVLVFADREMVNTVFRNLITNAIKFSNPPGEITITSEISGINVLITVSDNGTGMDQVTLNSLFSVGKNISRRGTKGEAGTGLGLLLCKEFIDKHNGKIWAESELGKGSNFKFTLPYFKE